MNRNKAQRLQLFLTHEAAALLDRLSAAEDVDHGEIIRRSMALYACVHEVKDRFPHVGCVRDPDVLNARFVGVHGSESKRELN